MASWAPSSAARKCGSFRCTSRGNCGSSSATVAQSTCAIVSVCVAISSPPARRCSPSSHRGGGRRRKRAPGAFTEVYGHNPVARGGWFCDVRGDPGLQCHGQLLLSTVTHVRIQQRRTSGRSARRVGLAAVVHDLEPGYTLRPAHQRRHLIRRATERSASSGRCVPARHPAEGHPQGPIIARSIAWPHERHRCPVAEIAQG